MLRLSLCSLLFLASLVTLATPIPAQTVSQPTVQPVVDARAVALLRQSLAAMTGPTAIADVTLSASVMSTAGSNQRSGTAVLQAKGTQESRVALNLSDSNRTEVRNVSDGAPSGSYVDSKTRDVAQAVPLHNCFTGAVWFVPSLSAIASSLTDLSSNTSYIGQETLDGDSVEHVRVWETVSSSDAAAVKDIARLSTTDIYLDAATNLPVAIRFATHPYDDSKVNIPIEVRFSNYQQASGILLPMHIQKLLNGTLSLDLTVNSAEVNSGLSDSIFSTN